MGPHIPPSPRLQPLYVSLKRLSLALLLLSFLAAFLWQYHAVIGGWAALHSRWVYGGKVLKTLGCGVLSHSNTHTELNTRGHV